MSEFKEIEFEKISNKISDPVLRKTYTTLAEFRKRKDLTLKPNKYLNSSFIGFDGKEQPMKFRYYQVQGILHLMAMNKFLLGDETGLGKTAQAIGALCYLWEKNPDRKVILLTTKSSAPQWVSEFVKFTKGIKVIYCQGSPKSRAAAHAEFDASTGPTVFVTGYRSAVQDIAVYQNYSNYILITDEASAYKSTTTQVHNLVKFLSSQATHTWALTATLIKNNLLEGYGIFSVLEPNLFGNKTNFLNNYCVTRLQRLPGSRRQVPVIVGYRSSDIALFREKIDPYFIGRAKSEVASELPPLTIKDIRVGMTKIQEQKYNEALSGLLEVGTGANTEEKEVSKLTAIIYCQQIVNHPGLIDVEGESEKLDALMDNLTEGDLAEEKVIVFTRFKKMVNIIQPILEKQGIKTTRITGDEDGKARAAAMNAFQDPNNDTRVILITMAASEAINLQAAKAIIFYDTPWSAGDYLQILGRMIRIGTAHDKVYALHLVCKGSVDERVMKVLRNKMTLVESVLGKRIKGEQDDITVSSENDISDLFNSLRLDALAAKK
jgi:SNF2 family DNA or RNA helicase